MDCVQGLLKFNIKLNGTVELSDVELVEKDSTGSLTFLLLYAVSSILILILIV